MQTNKHFWNLEQTLREQLGLKPKDCCWADAHDIAEEAEAIA